jgi:hypothetical protein
VLILSAPEGAYANAALSISLVRKLIDKGIISKEKMSGIVDEAGALLSQGNPIAMRQSFTAAETSCGGASNAVSQSRYAKEYNRRG